MKTEQFLWLRNFIWSQEVILEVTLREVSVTNCHNIQSLEQQYNMFIFTCDLLFKSILFNLLIKFASPKLKASESFLHWLSSETQEYQSTQERQAGTHEYFQL